VFSLKNIFFKQFNEKNLDNPHFFYTLKQDKNNPITKEIR